VQKRIPECKYRRGLRLVRLSKPLANFGRMGRFETPKRSPFMNCLSASHDSCRCGGRDAAIVGLLLPNSASRSCGFEDLADLDVKNYLAFPSKISHFVDLMAHELVYKQYSVKFSLKVVRQR
jgi:hypothetical protein